MEILGIIPARYNSTRFPGKPLAMIGDKSMIRRVYEQSQTFIKEVYVATDDNRIFSHVKDFGGNVVMTSEKHRSGTDRCSEAMDSIISGTGTDPDIVVNIQGDEPFIDNSQIDTLIRCFDDPIAEIATLVKKIVKSEDIFDVHKPKVVFDHMNFALYFSRSPIPFMRGWDKKDWLEAHEFYNHVGIYAYRKEVLKKITRLEISELERAESLEQLRWLQNGFKIKVAETFSESFGIDTPADLDRALKFLF
ncbi:MAG: 3-deoxy-manno-octulosonate cytidylyltransferase [Bacteroidota bacterium]